MSLFSSDQTQPTRLNGIRLNEAVLGRTLPIVIGQHRLGWLLGWYGDFESQQVQQGGGGSGLGKGGSTEWIYYSSVLGFVCMGPCSNFLSVYGVGGTGKYEVDTYSETYTIPASPAYPTYTPTYAADYAADAGAGVITPYSITVNDYGSPSPVTLTGNYMLPKQPNPPTNPTPPPGTYTPPQAAAAAGTCNTSGTTVTWVSGTKFSAVLIGKPIVINSVTYTVATCPSTTELTITVSAGTQTGVAFYTVGYYVFNSGDAGDTVTITYSAYRYQIIDEELADVPLSGPYVVTVENQSVWKSNVSVVYYPAGNALTAVSGSPGPGQYNPNGGNYTFNAAQAGQGIAIQYVYTDSNTSTNAPNTLSLTFQGGGLGQPPWAYLSSNAPSFALGYSEVCYVASQGMYLGYTNMLPQLNFEIAGAYQFGNGIVDANCAIAMYNLMCNPIYKLNFPIEYLHESLLGTYQITGSVTSGTFVPFEQVTQGTTGAITTIYNTAPTGSNPMIVIGVISGIPDATHTWVGADSGAVYTPTAKPAWTTAPSGVTGSQNSAAAYWASNNWFISAILDNQSSLMSIFGDWLEAGNTFVTWDEGLMKFIPLGDTTGVANGYIYQPPTGNKSDITQPVVDLDDNDFLSDKNKAPIVINQAPWQSRWNRTGVRYSPRANDYNEDTLAVDDMASINQWGVMKQSEKDFEFLTTSQAALFSASNMLQRFQAIFTTYKFTLKNNFCWLSPGDIVTITDGLLGTVGYMFGRTPVRIIKMTDSFPDKKGIEIEAENFPWSVGTALIGNPQAQIPSNTNTGQNADPGDTTAIIIEMPNRGAHFSGDQIKIFCNGTNSDWGGCNVFYSDDGTTYNFYQQVSQPARIGTTTADFPYSATNPDVTNSLTVNMSQSGAVLNSVSDTSWNNYSTLSGILSQQTGAYLSPVNQAKTGFNIGTSTVGPGGNEGPLPVTFGGNQSNGLYTPNWVNPGDVTGTSGFAHVTVSLHSSGGSQLQQFSLWMPSTYYNGGGFTVPLSGIGQIQGVKVTCNAYVSSYSPLGYLPGNPEPSLFAQLVVNGTKQGNQKIVFTSPGFPTTNTAYTLGSSTDLWGVTNLTAAFVNAQNGTGGVGDFGVAFCCSMGGDIDLNPSATISVNNVQIEVWWEGGSSGQTWINPNHVTSASLYATAPYSLLGQTNTLWLAATGFAPYKTLPFGFEPSGIEVTCESYSNTSGTAILTAQLYYQGQRIGGQINAQLTGSNATYYFGGSGDLWGVPGLNLDIVQDPTFGVAFIVTDSGAGIGVTEYLRNVKMTVYGNTSYALELIAYENANLVADNTYELTNIYRGLYGSYPLDSPSGSQFVRIDNNCVTYKVDPTYRGSSIFFKFTSFNTYQMQTQSLANVVAYEVPILGPTAAPGAIDADSGGLVTGIASVSSTNVNSTFKISPIIEALNSSYGFNAVPQGYALVQGEVGVGTPTFQPIISGGGGGGSISNIFYLTVSSSYNAAAWDYIGCDTIGGPFTIYLPAAADNPNVQVIITKISSDTNAVTVTADGSDTIGDNGSSWSFSYMNTTMCLTSDGVSNWIFS